MQFLTIRHSLNQVYNVEKRAIEQMAQKALGETKNIKSKKIDVTISPTSNTVSIDLVIAKKKEASFDEVITKLYNKIEQYIENIVGTKAKNIRITVSETY